MTIKTRKKLTAEWQDKGITQEKDYAILSNEMTKAWSGMSVGEYKQLKGLKKENLRDNMTNIELLIYLPKLQQLYFQNKKILILLMKAKKLQKGAEILLKTQEMK